MRMKKLESESEKQNKPHRSTGKAVTYVFTVVLLVIIVVAFVGAPALSGLVGSTSRAFGTYAGEQIVMDAGSYMVRQYEAIAQQVEQNGQQITSLLVNQVYREAFNRTVRHLAMQEHGQSVGMSVSQRAQDRAMARRPEFLVGGSFDRDEYEGMPSQQRFLLQEYVRDLMVDQQVRTDYRLPFELRDIASNTQFAYLNELFGPSLFKLPEVSDAEQAFLADMTGPERQFRFVQFAFSSFPDSEVISYGEANASRFRRANLSIISINTSEADASQLRDQILSGQATFEDIARNQSADIYGSDGGDMGFVYYHELEPDFEDVGTVDGIFELDEGDLSEVLETTFGWAIYRMDESPIAPTFDNEEVVAEVRNYMTTFERGIIEDYLTEQAEQFVSSARTDGFGAAATAINQSPQLTEYFPVNYGNLDLFGRVSAQSNTTLAAAATRPDFFTELFRLSSGDVTEPIVIRDYVFVMELADERAAPDDVRSTFTTNAARVVQQLSIADLQEAIVDEDLLVNQFSATYNRLVAN
jgi:parvulin-like peptidyl-prolyl isomerase